MSNGDAFKDMPEEYKEYRLSHDAAVDPIGKAADVEVVGDTVTFRCITKPQPEQPEADREETACHWYCNDTSCDDRDDTGLLCSKMDCDRRQPDVGEKPGAVASVLFKYDGGEWLHMAEEISVGCPPIEMPSDNGFVNYLPGINLFFLFENIEGCLPPFKPEDKGELSVVLLECGTRYEGKAVVTCSSDSMIEFKMNRNEVLSNRQPYTPDPLPDGLPSLNRCPDCDNTLEQRSMPDGIEEWCGECNAKVEIEAADTVFKSTATKQQIYFRGLHAKSCIYDFIYDAVEQSKRYALTGYGESMDGRYIDVRRCIGTISEESSTAAEGPMHPDMIRAELQKAIDGGYRMDIYPKAEYPQLKSRGELINQIVDGMVSMYTEHAGLYAYMNLDMIQSVKPYGSGE